MSHALRPLPFILAATNHGMMILNRNDHHHDAEGHAFGTAHQILGHGSLVVEELQALTNLLNIRRQHAGDGAVVLDCGANIGVYALEFARALNGWGHVYAFEAQEKIFYALAGNVIMNNFLNITARWNAVGSEVGSITIPELDYNVPTSFGSFELRHTQKNEAIGQEIDYAHANTVVPMISIDSLNLPRVDLIKIDVEGMEDEVLAGALQTIARCKPMLYIEIIKTDANRVLQQLSALQYKVFQVDMNVLCMHISDPALPPVEAYFASQRA